MIPGSVCIYTRAKLNCPVKHLSKFYIMGDAAEKLPVAVDESEMNLLLDDAGVNIWIDKYSDVFSDFDTKATS